MIAFLRYVLSFVACTFWFGGGVLLAGLLRVRPRRDGVFDRWARAWGRSMLRGTGIRVEVQGRERLDPDRSVVYIANHASFIDIWALLAELPGTVRFVYKKGMDWIPVMGQAMRAMRHIPIDRHNRGAAFAAYDAAVALMRSGVSAVVFAEGTRSRDGRLRPFKKGPFVLAIAAGAPVVPVFCAGTYELMPRGSWRPRRGTVTLRVGEPIPVAGLGYDDRDRLADETRAALLRLGARA